MVSQTLGKHSWHLSMDVRINQTLKDFGMIVWKKSSGKATKEGNLALTAKTKKFKKPSPQQKKGKKPQGKHSDVSKVECYNYHKFGHFARDCRQPKRKFKRRFQDSAAEEEEEEPKKKKNTTATKEDEPRREYYLICALS